MKQVRFAALAELDLDAIWQYVVEQSENFEVGDRVISAIIRRTDVLRHTPLAGRRRDEFASSMRSFPADGYLIYYSLRDDQVLVARIIHGSRDQAAALSEEPAT